MFKKFNAAAASIVLVSVAILTTQSYAGQKESKWNQSEIIKPHELKKILSGKSSKRPLVLQVGFQFLYEGGHVDGSDWAGPASRPDGIQRLKDALTKVPKNKQIVIYCGCCPWSECPNIVPAFKLMKHMGFKDVKMLYIPVNFEQDWISKGYPVTKGNKPGKP